MTQRRSPWNLLRPLLAFLRLEAAAGIVLLAGAVAALVWANVHAPSYHAVFETALGPAHVTARDVVNDGLMTAFFFVVGLEIKRELAVGELSSVSRALLPAVAALGGMVVPAAIFLAFNWHGPGRVAWGVPMATDIAFCVGMLTLLGTRVPRALVVFVMALAIFDDLGGILVIAFAYGEGVRPLWLAGAAPICALLFALNRRGVASALAYVGAGVLLWVALHHGGVHATIAGVIVGLAVPARARDGGPSLLDSLVHRLHGPVAFGVVPLFALANAGVALGGDASVRTPIALGAALGLFVGKPIGICAFTLAAVRLGISPMPAGASLAKLGGVSVLAGIGFTVALFIAAQAFAHAPPLLDDAKLGIFAGSVAAGTVGYAILRLTARVDA